MSTVEGPLCSGVGGGGCVGGGFDTCPWTLVWPADAALRLDKVSLDCEVFIAVFALLSDSFDVAFGGFEPGLGMPVPGVGMALRLEDDEVPLAFAEDLSIAIPSLLALLVGVLCPSTFVPVVLLLPDADTALFTLVEEEVRLGMELAEPLALWLEAMLMSAAVKAVGLSS